MNLKQFTRYSNMLMEAVQPLNIGSSSETLKSVFSGARDDVSAEKF